MMKLLQVLGLSYLLAFTSASAASSIDARELRCLALNLYFEARSDGYEGMVAVGWVVLNRIADAKHPNTVCEVIQQGGEQPPCHWSWWCDGRSDAPREAKAWTVAQQIARTLLSAPPPDPTQGALWFHHESIDKPDWLQARQPTARIGGHIFYK